MAILVAILALGALVAFHEWGHMWVARRMGMRVDRFSIGFGPTIFSWKRGETEYVLSAIPLGGYVAIAGMNPEEDDAADDPRSYMNKPAWRRALVIGAGPAANYLLAFLIGIPLLMVANPISDASIAKVGRVFEDGPAAQAGLQSGDRIVRINGREVTDWASLLSAVDTEAKASEGAPLAISVERAGTLQQIPVKPQKSATGGYLIGVAAFERMDPGLPFGEAFVQAGKNLYLASARTITMIGQMITGKSTARLSGPIGIVSQAAERAERGLFDFAQVVWLISLSLGLFNLLPVPALDGGRLLFIGYEALTRRRVNQRVELWIHTAGIVLLLGLIVFASYGDIMDKLRGS